MTDEKRMIGGFEVEFAMHIGEREVLLLLDPNSEETPFMVGYCRMIPALGLAQLEDVVGNTDYLEIAEEFLHRVQGQINQIRADRLLSSEPQEVFTAAQCLPGLKEERLVGRVLVIKPEALRPEYRNAAYQIVYVVGGFGAEANARGRAVFCRDVFSGEKSEWRRPDVLGILDPAHAPDWVDPGVYGIQTQLKTKGGKERDR